MPHPPLFSNAQRLLKRAAALHDAQQAVASWSASSNLPLATSSRSPDGASVELVQVMLPGDTVGFSPRSAVSAGVIAKLMVREVRSVHV